MCKGPKKPHLNPNPKAVDTSFFITGEYASERLIAEGHNDGIEIPITYYTPSELSFEYNALTNDTSSFSEISELVLDSVKEINAEQDSNRLNIEAENESMNLTDSMKDINIQTHLGRILFVGSCYDLPMATRTQVAV